MNENTFDLTDFTLYDDQTPSESLLNGLIPFLDAPVDGYSRGGDAFSQLSQPLGTLATYPSELSNSPRSQRIRAYNTQTNETGFHPTGFVYPSFPTHQQASRAAPPPAPAKTPKKYEFMPVAHAASSPDAPRRRGRPPKSASTTATAATAPKRAPAKRKGKGAGGGSGKNSSRQISGSDAEIEKLTPDARRKAKIMLDISDEGESFDVDGLDLDEDRTVMDEDGDDTDTGNNNDSNNNTVEKKRKRRSSNFTASDKHKVVEYICQEEVWPRWRVDQAVIFKRLSADIGKGVTAAQIERFWFGLLRLYKEAKDTEKHTGDGDGDHDRNINEHKGKKAVGSKTPLTTLIKFRNSRIFEILDERAHDDSSFVRQPEDVIHSHTPVKDEDTDVELVENRPKKKLKSEGSGSFDDLSSSIIPSIVGRMEERHRFAKETKQQELEILKRREEIDREKVRILREKEEREYKRQQKEDEDKEWQRVLAMCSHSNKKIRKLGEARLKILESRLLKDGEPAESSDSLDSSEWPESD